MAKEAIDVHASFDRLMAGEVLDQGTEEALALRVHSLLWRQNLLSPEYSESVRAYDLFKGCLPPGFEHHELNMRKIVECLNNVGFSMTFDPKSIMFLVNLINIAERDLRKRDSQSLAFDDVSRCMPPCDDGSYT